MHILIMSYENLIEEKVNINKIFGLNKDQFISAIIPENKYKKKYICLDRKYVSYSNDKTFTWVFNNDGLVKNGTVNITGEIENLISIKIFKFELNFDNIKYGNDQDLMTILIEELSAQSFISNENRRFHFCGKMSGNIQTDLRYQTEIHFNKGALNRFLSNQFDFNDGVYTFNKKIRIFDKISINFGSPYQLIPLYKDTYKITSFDGTAIATELPFDVEYNVFKISFINFLSDDDQDTNSQAFNREVIYIVNRVNDQLVNLTTPISLVGNFVSGEIYIEDYRFFIGMELTYTD